METEVTPQGGEPCDVIVPVHDGFEALERCLASLERHTPAAARIVLVDDASTDPRVEPLLRAFAHRRPGTRLLAWTRNRGFVGTVNRALAEAPGDVVVLNSDTQVTAGWLEGLVRCRRSDPAIGMVCPLSNNATLLGLEGVEVLYRDARGEIDVEALGACVAAASRREYPRIPTAVGFCMLLTRELLEAVGALDPAFGRGYGEENDLSMRALDRGFAIACCDDVYVHHAGGASFGGLRGIAAEREANATRFARRWPAYAEGVPAWWRGGGLRRVVERVNAAAERERLPGRPRVLQVVYRFGSVGGVEEHTRALVEALSQEAAFTVLAPRAPPGLWADFASERPAPHLRVVRMNGGLASPFLHVLQEPAAIDDPRVESAFASLVASGFDVVHFQSPVGWNTLRLPQVARRSGASVVVSVHDMAWMCADYNMVTGPEQAPCGRSAARGSDAGCVACIRAKSTATALRAPPPISDWIDQRLAAASDAMAAADAIVCPSRFARSRVLAAFGEPLASRVRVIPHGVADLPLVFGAADRPMLRVAHLGRLSLRKGGRMLVEAARRLAGRRVVIEAWGPVHDGLDVPAREAGIQLRGEYRPRDLPRLLAGIDLVVVTTTLEETYCLVVSEAQRLGIPVAATALGAIPERVREAETGFLLPPGDSAALAALLVRLRDDRRPLEQVAQRLRAERPRTTAESAADYAALYRELPRRVRARDAAEEPPAAGGDAVRAHLGFPRQRRHTRLGGDDYERWLATEAPRAQPAASSVAVVAFEAPDPLDENAGVAALNRAIASSGTEWVALHERGDRLEPGAAERMARAGDDDPAAVLLYCDHDAVSLAGDRYDPVFKPAFDAELLLHAPFITGLCVVRRAPLVALGGLRAPGWEGVLDLALRLVERGRRDAIVGVPELLVHRLDVNLRALEDESPGRRLRERVSAHLARHGRQPFLLPAAADAPSMWAHAPPGTGLVSVLLRAAPAPAHAAEALLALLARTGGRVAEVFVDLPEAACRELAARVPAQAPRTRLVPVAAGGAGLASALQRAAAEWVLILDARVRIASGAIERLEQGVAGPDVAAIAADLRDASGAVVCGADVLGGGAWSVAGPMPAPRAPGSAAALLGLPREISAVSGRLVLLRRAAALPHAEPGALAELGAFDMTHLSLVMVQAGHRLLARPFIAGEWAGRFGIDAPPRAPWSDARRPVGLEAMRRRWGERLERDARFPAAFAATGETLALAPRFPPRTAGGAAPLRICAFPFDRWGSGEVRVRQPCAALERAGRAHVVMMAEHDSGRAPNAVEMARLDPDVILAHNFFHDYQLHALEEYARRSKALRVLGMDDLLTQLPADNPYAAMIYPDIAERIARAVELCDRLVASTAPIAEAYARGKDVRIVPNAIDLERWGGLRNVPRAGPRPRVGWAGARQHLEDLRLLLPVVRATAGEIDWVFFGMCPPEIRALGVEVHEMVPVGEYPARLAALGLDVAVAPLRDHAFNRAKSALRLLEYGVLGLPVVASCVLPYGDAPAFTVEDDAEAWIAAVRRLAHDRDAARAAGEAMRRWVLTRGTLQGAMEEWVRALQPGAVTHPGTTLLGRRP